MGRVDDEGLLAVGGEHRHHRLLPKRHGVERLAVGDVDERDGAVADAAGQRTGAVGRDGDVVGLLARGNGGDHLLGGGVDDADRMGTDVGDQGQFSVTAYGDVVGALAGLDGGDCLAGTDTEDLDVARCHVGNPDFVGKAFGGHRPRHGQDDGGGKQNPNR